MKNICLKLLFALVMLSFAGLALPQNAQASAEGNSDECAWFKSRAMAEGRAGNRADAEHYWQVYYDCMYIPGNQ